MAQALTHAFISKNLEPGRYFDSTKRLHLFVKPNGSKYWVYRYTLRGNRRDLGLGSYPQISLAEARDRAAEWNSMLSRKLDPLQNKKESAVAEPVIPTFKVFASDFIDMNQAQWRNPKHTDQWRNTLRDYAYPIIGDLPLNVISTEHILRILSVIWTTKAETASRLRGRLERVLAAATTRGLRSGVNPAMWRGHLENILPKPQRIRRIVHHPAIPYRRVCEVVTALREKNCVSALALEFLILTAARTGEVRLAKISEIVDGMWIVPGSRMKAGREHRVPLTPRCLEIIQIAKSVYGDSEYLFHRNGNALSNVAMAKILRTIVPGFTVHGFRSTFRDWAAEETDHSGEVVEMALAHRISNQVEAAYRRGDLMDKRRNLMLDWVRYCNIAQQSRVIDLNERRGVA